VKLVNQLDALFQESGNIVIRNASDALALEQLISDKLYRALLVSMKPNASSSDNGIIEEALVFYETSRLIEVLPE
jgi:hypothetical protein